MIPRSSEVCRPPAFPASSAVFGHCFRALSSGIDTSTETASASAALRSAHFTTTTLQPGPPSPFSASLTRST